MNRSAGFTSPRVSRSSVGESPTRCWIHRIGTGKSAKSYALHATWLNRAVASCCFGNDFQSCCSCACRAGRSTFRENLRSRARLARTDMPAVTPVKCASEVLDSQTTRARSSIGGWSIAKQCADLAEVFMSNRFVARSIRSIFLEQSLAVSAEAYHESKAEMVNMLANSLGSMTS